ncbi:hypothetical protein ACLMJK_007101 [Lecanora helva]
MADSQPQDQRIANEGSSRAPADNVVTTDLSQSSSQSQEQGPPSHIDLGPAFYEYYTWSNNKDVLELDTYFNSKKPNLGDEFGLKGLQPVIREKDGDTFLLKAGNS